ncbi:MAG: tetratricopeptide repeat protein [Myxococcota bacterium]
MSDESRKHTHRGIDLSDAEKWTAAIVAFDRAIAISPDFAQAWFERGMAKLNLDRDAEAIADFDRALAIQPNFPGALDWRSHALSSLGDHKSAAETALASLRANPNGPHDGMGVCPQSWADCAEEFIKAGLQDQATALLEEYFAQHASKVTVYVVYETSPMLLLAQLRRRQGAAAEAVKLMRSAVASAHCVPADSLHLALALEAAGELAEARELAAQALAFNGFWTEAQELADRLSET